MTMDIFATKSLFLTRGNIASPFDDPSMIRWNHSFIYNTPL